MNQDIWRKINNAVLDLQSADSQHYEQPLRRLSQLVNHAELQRYNQEITECLDLDDFLGRSEKTGGSMLGSNRLLWSDDHETNLGLQLLLIQKLGNDPAYAKKFCFLFYNAGTRWTDSIRSFVKHLIIPFAREYKDFVRSKGGLSMDSSSDKGTRIQSIQNNGILIMDSQNVTMENIRNLVGQATDEGIGEILEAIAKEISAANVSPERTTEMLQQVEALAEQATLPPHERKTGLIRAFWRQLVESADDISKVSDLLMQHGPAIAGFFEMTFRHLGA